MKYQKIMFFLLGVMLCTGGTGCKDYLEANPSTQVSDQVLFSNASGAQTLLNGIYSYIRLRNQDVEYGTIIQLNNGFDAAGNDLIIRNSMGQLQVYYAHNLAETRADAALTSNVWAYFYTIINNSNIILDNIDATAGDQSQKDLIKGQALAIRSWAYFYLVRFYQQTYAIAKDKPGIPYYSKGATTVGMPRASVSTVYTNIVNDLQSSIALLAPMNRSFKSQINQQVAQGFLAEVYLVMEDWTKAAEMAKAAKTGFPLMSAATYQAGFNDWGNAEWMWAAPQTSDSNFGNASPFTLWANQTRGDRWTFDFMYVNDTFKNLFEANDIRNQFWLRTDIGLWTSSKFRDAADYYGDVVLMRSSEMFLIEAEAYAKMGNETQAKTVLWQLQDQRNATRTSSGGSQLIEDILTERRKELYAEGFAWFDLIRNQKPVHREGDHPLKPEIPARSWRFILQIPTAEFTSNRSLTPGDQNPYDGIYTP